MALRLLKGVRELRFVLCQSSNHSDALRKYLANNHQAIRQSQARITVRECENTPPAAIATYSYGVEKRVELKKMTSEQIDQEINKLQAYSANLSRSIHL